MSALVREVTVPAQGGRAVEASAGETVDRGPEGVAFWRWLVTWRRRSKPALLNTIRSVAPSAAVHVLRTPRQLRRFLVS